VCSNYLSHITAPRIAQCQFFFMVPNWSTILQETISQALNNEVLPLTPTQLLPHLGTQLLPHLVWCTPPDLSWSASHPTSYRWLWGADLRMLICKIFFRFLLRRICLSYPSGSLICSHWDDAVIVNGTSQATGF
jgi:hypothetical protein